MIKQVHRLHAELQFLAFSEAEFFEKRGVGPPVFRPPQRVSLQVAKRSYRRFCKDSRIEEAISRPTRLCIAHYVGTIRTCVRDSAGIVANIEGQSALNRR